MIHFQCHACGAHLRAKDSQAGQKFACATCRVKVDVPDTGFPTEASEGDADGDALDGPVSDASAAASDGDWWSDVPAAPKPKPVPKQAPESSESVALALPPKDKEEEKQTAKADKPPPQTKLGKLFPDLDDPVKRKAILPGAAIVLVSMMSLMLAVLAVPVLMVSLYFVFAGPADYDACSTSGAMLWTIGSGIYFAMALVRGVHMLLLTDREQAMIGGMMMLVPCGPCWLLSLPVGLWVLSTLRDQQVRKAFKKP